MSMNLKINRYDTKKEKRRKVSDVIYVVITLTLFAFVGISMFIFPRSTESELENRELAKFPKFSLESFVSGEYTHALNTYFSDTVPYRDDLMVISSMIRNMTGFRMNDIKLHNVTVAENIQTEPAETLPLETEAFTGDNVTDRVVEGLSPGVQTSVPESNLQQEPFSEITAGENAAAIDMDDTVNITNNGIVVVGTRALMLYGGSYTVGESYANVVSEYKKQLGSGVNVYCMVIPTSVEFYCPESVKQFTSEQLGNINNIYANLKNGVKAVDAYTPLSLHVNEPIYFRTDHHWSSLGAYYAAKQFAETAGVPFSDLSEYDEKVVDGYVGTMYSYSEDIVIKQNPEDFVYYVPKNVEYTTTYHNYILGENNVIVGMQEPYDANFFIDFSNSKSMLYCTFMGGDAKITHVKTSTRNGRKLAIFKDSYGNALPQFLFGSFEEIYIMDMRFFTYNAIDYIKENGITDLLFANNAFHATTKSTVTHYENFLVQGRQAAPQETTATTPVNVPAVTGVTVTGITPNVTAPPVTSNVPTVTTLPTGTVPVPATTSTPVTTTTPTTTSVTSVMTTTAAPAATSVPPKTTAKPRSETSAPATTVKPKKTKPKSETTAGHETTAKKTAETTVPASTAAETGEIIADAD